MYDETGHLLGEYDGSGTLVQEIVWLNDIPVATLRPNGASVSVYYIHTDHLNTPRRISRTNDNVVVWRWDSDPFGSTAANEDPDGDAALFAFNLRFPGQYYDAESGLNYNYFRDYDPAIGRYIESDPIGLDGGVNTYSYVSNDPLSKMDRFGLEGHGPIRRESYGGCLAACRQTCFRVYDKDREQNARLYLDAVTDCRLGGFKKRGSGANYPNCLLVETIMSNEMERFILRKRDRCLVNCGRNGDWTTGGGGG
jgi:RHS repeat-associated protein